MSALSHLMRGTNLLNKNVTQPLSPFSSANALKNSIEYYNFDI